MNQNIIHDHLFIEKNPVDPWVPIYVRVKSASRIDSSFKGKIRVVFLVNAKTV